ncbi:MAG: hypothetical protein AUG52_02310 [Verrucomicrobia bacterium 13_1_20CM_3_54_17]|nr:MAG: hypothetical protein AUG52_02310 [Verrucomicrobia bacterium 13_1_20CM_3_54_17]
MKRKSASQSAFFNLRVLIGLFVVVAGVFQALFATSGAGLSFGSRTAGSVQIKAPERPVNPISPRGGVQEEWVARYNGGYGPDVADAIAVDGSGNVYVTGSSIGPGTCNLACVDYATIKYDPSGTQQWAARYNGPASDSDQASAIAVDASGNVYVTGSSIGTTWPDYDYATIKYDSSGQQQWVARYSGPGNDLDFGNAIAVDPSGNVYVTGASFGSGTGFDYATVKYDSSGQQQWVARYNGPGNADDEAYGIAVDASGNVYVTGFSDNSGFDYATIKYDSSGQQQWVGRYNGPANDDDEARAITIDGSGNVYVTGYSVGSGTQEDYATIKYNASGTEEWVARYNGQANFNDDAAAIAVDASGNVYVAGWSVGSGSGYDYATVKYDSSGAEQWIARYDGAASVDDQSYAIAVDDSGDVCVTGYSTVDAKTGLTDYTTIKYSQTPSPTPTSTASPTPTTSPSATPRTTPTPRPRPTPAPRPTPRQ